MITKSPPPKKEEVDHPKHYNKTSIEVIDVIEAFVPDSFNLGNVLKYVLRFPKDGTQTTRLMDLKKARWYLQRELSRLTQ